MRTRLPITAAAATLDVLSTRADLSTTAVLCTPGTAGAAGLNSADTLAKYAYGLAQTMRAIDCASGASAPSMAAPALVLLNWPR